MVTSQTLAALYMMIVLNISNNLCMACCGDGELVMKTTMLGPVLFAPAQELVGLYSEPVLPYTVLTLLLTCRSTPPGNLPGELQVSSKLQ